MTVTKQTYTATATWTAAQFRDLMRSAFIDAGLMTEWYDSFTNGSLEHAILEVTYDGAKTYGKTYYWFIFTTTEFHYFPVTGWDAGTHVPTGTQYLDYYSTATNTVANHVPLGGGYVTSQQLSVVRYTSGIDSTHSVFRVQNNGNWWPFLIQHGSHPVPAWVDLDKQNWQHLLSPIVVNTNPWGAFLFWLRGGVKRTALLAPLNYNSTSSNRYNLYPNCVVARYDLGGKRNDSENAYTNLPQRENLKNRGNQCHTTSYTDYANGIWLTNQLASENPTFSSDRFPVFTGLPYSMYVNEIMPADLGFSALYSTWSQVPGQTLEVTEGVEEWEIIHCLPAGQNPYDYAAKPLFLARTV